MNQPLVLAKVLTTLEGIQKDFGKTVSLADLIVLGGCAPVEAPAKKAAHATPAPLGPGGGAAVEAAPKKAGHDIPVPFAPGRTDATQQQTDAASFAPLEQT